MQSVRERMRNLPPQWARKHPAALRTTLVALWGRTAGEIWWFFIAGYSGVDV